MRNNKQFLIIGTILSYIGLYFIPSIRFSPIPLGIFTFLLYKYFSDIKKTLFICAIFTLPYSWGKSFFYFGDSFLFKITAFSFFVILLSILSIKDRVKFRYIHPFIYLSLFFIWAILSFILVNTSALTFSGLFNIAISLLFYLLVILYIKDQEIISVVVSILISTIVFESCFTIMQFLLGHPLGKFIEEASFIFPFGKMSSEDVTLYRPSGTMSSPTWLSRYLSMLLPFLLLYPVKFINISKISRTIIIFVVLLAILVTLTRVSWVSSLIVLLIYLFLYQKPKKWFQAIRLKHIIIGLIIILFVFLFISPFIYKRIETSPLSFEEGGSFDIRIQYAKEAVNIITQYPLFGVGVNNFINIASDENITGIFVYNKDQVHNLILLIASEIGVPPALFFLLFIFTSYFYYFKKRRLITSDNELLFKDSAMLGGIVYIMETTLNITFLAPHFYLFFLFLGILVS